MLAALRDLERAAPNAFFRSSRCIAGTSSIAALVISVLNSGSAIRNTTMFEMLLRGGAHKCGTARNLEAWSPSK